MVKVLEKERKERGKEAKVVVNNIIGENKGRERKKRVVKY